jgi:hypothetical protein
MSLASSWFSMSYASRNLSFFSTFSYLSEYVFEVFLNDPLNLCYCFPFASFVFDYAYFSQSLGSIFMLLIWDFFWFCNEGTYSYKLSSLHYFLCSKRFWQVVFSFSLDSRNFLILSLFLWWPTLSIQEWIILSPYVWIVKAFSHVTDFYFNSIVVWQIQEIISTFLYLLRLASCPKVCICLGESSVGCWEEYVLCGYWVGYAPGIFFV